MQLTLRQVAGPVLATMVLQVVFVGLYVSRLDGDPSALVCVGENHIGRFPYEFVTRACGPTGHDGQYYYAVARAPWKSHRTELDLPAYRHIRILYPAVCWVLSAGHPVLLFYIMPLVNVLAVAALALLGARLAVAHGRSAWWGAVLPLGVNAAISVTHNFTDCVSNLAVFGLISAWLLRGSWQTLALWASAAVFAREQNVAIAGLVALAGLWNGRREVAAAMAVVCAVWAGWVAVFWLSYGAPPWAGDGANLSAPLAGLAYRFRHVGDTGHRFSLRLGIIHALSALYLVALLGAGLWVARWRLSRTVVLLLVGGVTLALLGGTMIYLDVSSYLRVYSWVPLGLWIAGITTGRSWPQVLLTPGLVWSLVVALRFA